MTEQRMIKKRFKGQPTIEGAGVHLKRGFGNQHVPAFDPFLLLDDFHSYNPADYLAGFPWHPHRGIETITYVLQGLIEHGDSMGNKGTIGAGEIQWMTAGSGIIHQEMPQISPTGMLWGFQIWANLPASHKMMAPRYRGLLASDIPETTTDSGVVIKVISGEVNGVRGPVQDVVTDPEYMDVTIPASGSFTHNVEPGHTVFAYVLEGQGYFDERRDDFSCDTDGGSWSNLNPRCICGPEEVVLYEREGDHVVVTAGKDAPARFLLLTGRPLNEPVAWYGPIVMNTNEELRVAFDEYQRGTFVK